MSLQKHALQIIVCYLLAVIGNRLLLPVPGGETLALLWVAVIVGVAWAFDRKLVIPNAVETPGLASPQARAVWGVSGIALVLIGQVIGTWLEGVLFHLPAATMGQPLALVHQAPAYALVLIIGLPVLEELCFRRVIFGNLAGVIGLVGAAIVSGLLFALVTDPTHWLMGTLVGLVYAFLYQHTGSVQTSLIAHIGMVAMTLLYALSH